MAAPFVAGVAALLKSLHPGYASYPYSYSPGLTAAQIKIIILGSVDITPQLRTLCVTGGKLNAYKAVTHVPIVGSRDINFSGVGTIGKLHLFYNGTWVILERGVPSYPISYHPGTNPDYLSCDPIPGIGVSGGSPTVVVLVPTLSASENIY
jgi:hypothetical protein